MNRTIGLSLLSTLILMPACSESPTGPVESMEYVITGRVTKAEEPEVGIPDARVRVLEGGGLFNPTYFSTRTDPDGYYMLVFKRKCWDRTGMPGQVWALDRQIERFVAVCRESPQEINVRLSVRLSAAIGELEDGSGSASEVTVP